MNKKFVLSAVNIVDGGPLTILASFIEAMQNPVFADWQFIALVHPSVGLDFGRVKKVNLAAPKKSWLMRLYYEYIVFKRISQRFRPDVWFSLHDITPNVEAPRRFVYCHNPAPFYQPTWRDIWLDPKFFLFNKLYKWLYKFNIDENDAVIVQQSWLGDEFLKFTQVPIHVSHPGYVATERATGEKKPTSKVTYIYPAFPRVFKNHVVICEALNALTVEERAKIRVVFTVSGRENRYAAWLVKRYGHIDAIEFRGRLSYKETQKLYEEADCVLFPSKLETWGLPLTEARFNNKKILCSNLEFAKENLGDYQEVEYINPSDRNAWAMAILNCMSCSSPERNLIRDPNVKADTVGSVELLKFLTN